MKAAAHCLSAMAKRQLGTTSLILGLLFSNLICSLGKLECEDLPIEDCAFSVASTGTRCVLEKYQGRDNSIQYECQSSIITAEKQEEWIESDECVRACGLERMSVGLSTDLLMDYHFTEMFCSAECLNNCPNIIDLYISLAAGEGMYLPQLCKAHRTRRVIADPVKKAMDAEYLRSILPQLTGAMAPDGSPIPGSGLLPRGPDYRGYGGYERTAGEVSTGGETIAPVAGSGDALPAPHLQRSAPAATTSTAPSAATSPVMSPSSSKRPFFFVPAPTTSSTVESVPDYAGAVAPESAISPVSPSVSEVPAVVPSSSSPSEVAVWTQKVSVKSFQQMNDEEYLYETYFN